MAYHVPPPVPPAFPYVRRVVRKTPVRGGKALRKRWKDDQQNIYEWDSMHGTVEVYNKRGRHVGEFDPNTGDQLKPADPSRWVEP